jgi:hypothetical protein
VRNGLTDEGASTSSVDAGPIAASSYNIRLSILVHERNANDHPVITRTWREIRGTCVDEVEPEIQRPDNDSRKEPSS